jgi:hypothetical protein
MHLVVDAQDGDEGGLQGHHQQADYQDENEAGSGDIFYTFAVCVDIP